MKRWMAIASLAWSAIACAAPADNNTDERYVWASKLIVHAQPDTASPAQGRLVAGTRVARLEGAPARHREALAQAGAIKLDGT